MDKLRRGRTASPLRQTFAVALGILGLWTLQLTGNLPPWQDQVLQLVRQPDFALQGLNYTMSYYPQEELSPLGHWVLSRWGLLQCQDITLSGPQLQSETSLPPLEPPKISQAQEEDHSPIPESQEGQWVTRTIKGSQTGNYLYHEGIYVTNMGKVSLDEEDLQAFSSFTLDLEEESPQILILHSHATESYTQIPGYTYQESEPYRTLDASQNILAVGQAMTQVLEEAGFSVIHDKTIHDYPSYNDSYSNSAQTVADYLAKYPSISLVLDVHRDALAAEDTTPYQLISQQGEEEVAQVMLVVGSNGGGSTHDHWRENFSLALSLQEDLLQYGDFARPIVVRTGRFNQHLSTGSLLVEIGGHGNTLPQAIAAGTLFAESLAESLS